MIEDDDSSIEMEEEETEEEDMPIIYELDGTLDISKYYHLSQKKVADMI